MNTKLILQGLVLTSIMASAQFVSAATYFLCAGVTTLTMPDSTNITMWGYGLDNGTPNCSTATIPGPQLVVPTNQNSLIIYLRNTLPEPSSIIVPGLSSTSAPAPVFFTDSQGRQRARSMTHEAAANFGFATYSFKTTPGTYLYHSGSHPSVQVQMGLYGGIKQDFSLGEAYSNVSYDNEIILLYSEIDPDLHTAVTNGTYGTVAYPTTINYAPKYHLVNGESYTTATPDLSAGSTGQTTLLRLINAGLKSHAPTLQMGSMDMIAEYGSAYPYARKQSSLLLAAGQTKDAIFKPKHADRYAIYDRKLSLTNNLQTNGGLISFLNVTPAAENPVAFIDVGTTDEDLPLMALNLAANDTDSDGTIDLDSIFIPFQPSNGTVTVNNNGTGTVSYTPNTNFNGSDTFTYVINDNLGNSSNEIGVNITVNSVNDSPVANDDLYSTEPETLLTVSAAGVLANDTDVESGVLTAQLQTDVSGGTLNLNSDGSFTYMPNLGTSTDSFAYQTIDSDNGVSNTATVTININSIPIIVTLISPSGDIGTNNTPTYTWNSIFSATEYKLWTKNSAGIITQFWYSSTEVNCGTGESVCTFIPTNILADGTHMWKVRARNSADLGPWAPPLNFNIGSIPLATTLLSPTGAIGANPIPTFEWNPIAGATSYKLWVKDLSSGIVNQAWYTSTQVNCGNGEVICSHTSATSLADGNHSWKVRVRNSFGMSPWSSLSRFFIGAPPTATTLIGPSGNITISTPIYSWIRVNNTSFYQLKVVNSSGTAVINVNYTPTLANCDNGEATCSVTSSITQAIDTYSWKVKTKNDAGHGPWSSQMLYDLQ